MSAVRATTRLAATTATTSSSAAPPATPSTAARARTSSSGGATSYDNNLTALHALQAEWSSGASNATRISDIRNGGGLNGTFVLKVGAGATIFDDSAKDTYIGGSNRDWFFRRNTGGTGSRDVILDVFAGEELTDF